MTDRLSVIKASQSQEVFSLTSTIQNIAEKITDNPLKFSNNEIMKSTTSYINASTDFVTEDYNYNNPDYFEIDSFTQSSTVEPTVQTSMEPFEFFEFNMSKILENVSDYFMDTDNSSQIMMNNNSSFILDPFMNFTNYTMSEVEMTTEVSSAQFLTKSDPSVNFNNLMIQPNQNYIELNHLNASTQLEIRRLCWETVSSYYILIAHN